MSTHRPRPIVEFIVHYVYLGTMVLNGGLFLFLPREAPLSYDQYKNTLMGFLGLVFLTFPLVMFIYRRYASPEAIKHIQRTVGVGKASAAFKVGCIILTLLGDFSGIAGASLFTFTRDPYSLPVFLGSWAIQYAFSASVVRRGRKVLAELESAQVPVRATA